MRALGQTTALRSRASAAQRLLTELGSSRGAGMRVARGTAWSIAGTLAQQACLTLASIFAARLLGMAAFGEFGLVRSTILTFGALAGSGLALAATKVVAEHRSDDPARAGRAIALLWNGALVAGGAAVAACHLLAPWLADTVMQAPALASALRLASILLLLNAVGGVQNGVLLGLEAFRPFSLLLVAEGLLTLIGIGAGSALGGLDGAVLGSSLGPLLVAFPRHRAMRAECARLGIPTARRGTAAELPLIWSAVLPAVLIVVSAQPFEWLGRVLLARGSGGYAAVGVFTAAYAWGQLVAFAAAQLTTPAIPVMVNVLATGDRRGFRSLLRLVGLATLGVTAVTVIPMIALSGVIMRAYGADFSPGGAVLAVLAAAYGVSSLSTLFRAVLVSTGRFWTQNLHVLIWGAVLVAGVFLFDRLDALGLALAYLVAYTVVVLTQGIAAWRALGAHRPAEGVAA